jgi:hypothetical protein
MAVSWTSFASEHHRVGTGWLKLAGGNVSEKVRRRRARIKDEVFFEPFYSNPRLGIYDARRAK